MLTNKRVLFNIITTDYLFIVVVVITLQCGYIIYLYKIHHLIANFYNLKS